MHQKGFLNARAALRRAFREFPDPDAVFVTGCSAGSVGSAFHADAIYVLRLGGVRLRDWVADLAAGRDVECPECGSR